MYVIVFEYFHATPDVFGPFDSYIDAFNYIDKIECGKANFSIVEVQEV